KLTRVPNCPLCLIPLRTMRQREGIYFLCERCQGRAVAIPQIRRVAGDHFATQLLRTINQTQGPELRPCPFCSRPMKQFTIAAPPLTLDACRSCAVVWFDHDEFEAVPEGVVETPNELEL